MTILGTIFNGILNGLAQIIHPDRPRLVGANAHFATDYTKEQVLAALNEVAKGTPLAGWYERRSITDLMKLAHPENPDGASNKANRTALAKEMGRDDYSGTAEDNLWLFDQTIKAIQQRGIPLPSAD